MSTVLSGNYEITEVSFIPIRNIIFIIIYYIDSNRKEKCQLKNTNSYHHRHNYVNGDAG